MLLALISFLPTDGRGTIGSLEYPDEERVKLAKRYFMQTHKRVGAQEQASVNMRCVRCCVPLWRIAVDMCGRMGWFDSLNITHNFDNPGLRTGRVQHVGQPIEMFCFQWGAHHPTVPPRPRMTPRPLRRSPLRARRTRRRRQRCVCCRAGSYL